MDREYSEFAAMQLWVEKVVKGPGRWGCGRVLLGSQVQEPKSHYLCKGQAWLALGQTQPSRSWELTDQSDELKWWASISVRDPAQDSKVTQEETYAQLGTFMWMHFTQKVGWGGEGRERGRAVEGKGEEERKREEEEEAVKVPKTGRPGTVLHLKSEMMQGPRRCVVFSTWVAGRRLGSLGHGAVRESHTQPWVAIYLTKLLLAFKWRKQKFNLHRKSECGIWLWFRLRSCSQEALLKLNKCNSLLLVSSMKVNAPRKKVLHNKHLNNTWISKHTIFSCTSPDYRTKRQASGAAVAQRWRCLPPSLTAWVWFPTVHMMKEESFLPQTVPTSICALWHIHLPHNWLTS